MSYTMTLWIWTVRDAVLESGMTKMADPSSPARSPGRIKCERNPPAASPGLSKASKARRNSAAVRHQPCTHAVVTIASRTLSGMGARIESGCVRFHCLAAFQALCKCPTV
eukprot:6490321-Amphidinium_carterae.1